MSIADKIAISIVGVIFILVLVASLPEGVSDIKLWLYLRKRRKEREREEKG